MLEWLKTCYKNRTNDIYSGILTYTIAGQSVSVNIQDRTHFTYAYDHMYVAQENNTFHSMKITFEGNYKNQNTSLSFESLAEFLDEMKPLLDFSLSRARYTKIR